MAVFSVWNPAFLEKICRVEIRDYAYVWFVLALVL